MSRATIRERLSKATPGPWKAECVIRTHPDREPKDCGGISPSLCMGHDYDWYGSVEERDRALIAHAPTDLAALLAVADAAAELMAEDESGDGSSYRDIARRLERALHALESAP